MPLTKDAHVEHTDAGDRRIIPTQIPPQDFASLFYVWLDDQRRPLEHKLAAACAAYEARFGRLPSVILISQREDIAGAPAGIALEARSYIRPHHYWLRIDAPVEAS